MKLKRILKWSAAVILLVVIGWLFIAYWTSTNDCNRSIAATPSPMKAILNCEYGVRLPQLRDIEKPTPADNEVLVRVRAASVNPVDGHDQGRVANAANEWNAQAEEHSLRH